MLKIKLARIGKKNQPHYRFVVSEARSKRDSGYIANIGHYAPTQTPKVLEINVEEYQSWLSKGAQPTPTVAGLFARFQSGNPFPPKKAKPSKKSLEKAKAEAEAKAKPKEEVAVEAPVEEAPTEEAKVADETKTEEATTETSESSAESTAKKEPAAEATPEAKTE